MTRQLPIRIFDANWLTDNPNTDDIIGWVHSYADASVAAYRAQQERKPDDADKIDAARYRWLRSKAIFWAPFGYEAKDEQLDEAIDRAIEGTP